MIVEVCRVLCCLAAGEVAACFSPIPLPGSVIGLTLLFLWLCVIRDVPLQLEVFADRMLELFGLFFVPAGVGVMIYRTMIERDLVPIVLAVSVGTLVTICVTGIAASLIVSRNLDDVGKRS